jgi:MFS family permease
VQLNDADRTAASHARVDAPCAAMAPRASLARTAWLAVALLWPVAMLNYLDRQMLASMKFSVMADVPDIGTDGNWGLMLGQFKWVYAFFSPLGGFVADRFGRRATIACSLFAWSAVTILTGSATTFRELMWARTLMGVSEAFYIPAALALIADLHSERTRSRAVGVHQTAIYVGMMAGGFGGYVADAPALGWRFAFHAAGAVGVLYALPLTFVLGRVERAAEARAQPLSADPSVRCAVATDGGSDEGISPLRAARELLGSLPFLLLVACFTLPALAGWIVRDWMPAILKQQFGLGQGVAGVSATLYLTIAMLVGVAIGGVLADRWSRITHRGRAFTGALGILLLVPALFGVGNAGTLAVAVAFLALFGLGWGLFDCNNMPILCQIARPGLRATGYGIMNLVSISCGGLADWAFGRMRDAGWPLNASFAAFAAMALVAVGLMVWVAKLLPTPAGETANSA